jgi:formylglycine-generating enzyme
MNRILVTVCVLVSCLGSQAQSPASGAQLRLKRLTNTYDLTVSSLSATGALFIFQATNLQSLVDNPSLLLQTNNPSTNDVSMQVTPSGNLASQAFFSAAHWPGFSTHDFGDPADYPYEPPPDAVLVTSGLPNPLVSGQQFTVDFFVIDPAGPLLNITRAVSVRVLRETDGSIHPDAQVLPSTGQMVGGHLQLTITITATTSLDGYTLGLGPAGMMLMNLTAFLKTAFNISTSISGATSNALYQALENLRTASADPNPVWAYPLSGANYPVAGTFGEWRGDNDTRVHYGLDLAAPGTARALASRGGVVSRKGAVSGCMGDYVVIDHGDGWFSRYLHLSPASIGVKGGQAVTRGQTLATNLLTGGCIGTHLHFEIRRGPNQSQWNVGSPGSAQDPLQIDTINPGSGIFAVPLGSRPPELEEFGLIGSHPGANPFVKSTTTITEAPGPVYVCARFLDREAKTPGPGCDGGFYRLGLRAIGFQPENVTTNNWIWTTNDVAVASYLPAASGGMTKGFARYNIPPQPQRCDYFRYWWKWDTSIYTNATGPRSIVLTGVDFGGATSNYTFTFGPEIKGGKLAMVNHRTYQFTNVAYLGTNSNALFVQPDQYKLQILQTNGLPLPGVTWSPALLAGDYTPVINTHTNEQTYAFTLPSGENPDGLKLRVSSRLATNLAHEICLCGGTNMAFISSGFFMMGDTLNDNPLSNEHPPQSAGVSSFCMDKFPVTKALWNEVKAWSSTNGYSFDSVDSGQGKAGNYPAHTMTWYDAVKWCNARSEKDGLTPCYYTDVGTVYKTGQVEPYVNWFGGGYRLPTEAEREKAARGGVDGQRFPWGNTISWFQANYYALPQSSQGGYDYDVNSTEGLHPTFNDGIEPLTNPVGYFFPNKYGLYDMVGNNSEWCWDWYGLYCGCSQINPGGPASGSYRVIRGGGWGFLAIDCRSASRNKSSPTLGYNFIGFRCARAAGR